MTARTLILFLIVLATPWNVPSQDSRASNDGLTTSQSETSRREMQLFPCKPQLKEKIAKMQMADGYFCNDRPGGINISSPRELVEEFPGEPLNGLRIHVYLSIPPKGTVFKPTYQLSFSHSSTFRSKNDIVRYLNYDDKTFGYLTIIADEETIVLQGGSQLGNGSSEPGNIIINETRRFELTVPQLIKLAAAVKVSIKLGERKGIIPAPTQRAMRDVADLPID